jgi:hypothetical protein
MLALRGRRNDSNLEGTMSALFKRSDEKVAQDQAATAETERLVALPPADLAAEVLPAFAAENVKPHVHSSLMACQFLMSSFPKGTRMPLRELDPPVRAALQQLLNAGLLMERAQPNRPPQMYITPLGETALSEGDVRRYL